MLRPLPSLAVFALALCAPALAPCAAAAESDRIAISYATPTNPEHARIAAMLQDNRVLEELREYLSPLRLPDTLTLGTAECGEANAWYENQAVTVCYEYVAELERQAPSETTPAGVTREDAILGPLTEVFLHEVSHAIFDMLKVPILGREEDAADRVAAYLLLNLGKEEARRAVAGTAYMYLREARAFTPDLKTFAGTHAVPAQRFYDLICLSYGADPVLFASAVSDGYLPQGRADECGDEYRQLTHAFRALIAPHLDPERVAQFQSRRWLKFKGWSMSPP